MFTTLGMIGRTGPVRIGNPYTGQDHDGQVTLSSGIQQWTVPHTGEYRIEAIGIQWVQQGQYHQERWKRGTNDWKLYFEQR